MNLAHLLDGHDPQRVAIVSRGRETTYAALVEQIDHVRGGLAELGVGRGDRVALVCSNGRFFVEAYFATLGLGAVAVPMNPTSPAPELARQLTVVGAKVVVVEPNASAAWSGIDRSSIPVERVVATEGRVAGADVDFAQLLAAEPVPLVEVDDDDLAVLMFTSGTAGAPRAAMLSHGNLSANIEQARTVDGGIVDDDVVFGVLPLFHIYGLNVVLAVALARGATVVLVQRFDPSTALDTIRQRGVTVLPGAPPLWLAFSHFEDAPNDALAGVRIALCGAAKISEEAIRRVRDHFGVEIREGYGLTEASPVVTSSAGIPVRIGSVGKVIDGVSVRLVDAQGDDALQGDEGEIWVQGANVFHGYLDDPEATARVLTDDGWLRTGDIAVTDEDGYLYLVDRAKDVIIVSGFNVYPAEIEDVIAEHPAVADVGVVGVSHPHSGEAVKAFVVVEPGATIDEETLIDWCADHVARYKCPSKVLFVDALPRGLSGKLLRRALG